MGYLNSGFYIGVILLLLGCGSKQKQRVALDIDTSPESIAMGKTTFETLCSACHNFRQDGIGPNLTGLTQEVDAGWIADFIRDPQKMIQDQDARALELFKKYRVYMPGFPDLSESEMAGILAYLHTVEPLVLPKSATDLAPLSNPIQDTIGLSDLVAEIAFFAQIPPSQEKSPLARINKMACAGGSGRVFVNDQRGFLYELQGNRPHLFLSLPAQFPDFIHQPGLATGFGSYAFHPRFEQNGLFYTTHAEPAGTQLADFSYDPAIKVTLQWVVTEWRMENPAGAIFSGDRRELMRIDFVTGVHGVQEIAFNPTAAQNEPDFGKLYIAMGDGGSVENGFVDLSYHGGKRVWGSIIRIDPNGRNSANGKYGIPADNPFASFPDKAGEVWAYGFRNPNKLTWDNFGRLLATDIGHVTIEEVNNIAPGKFYGWPIREGTFMIDPYGDLGKVFHLPDNDADFGVEYPLIQYDHDESKAIAGGYVANGPPFHGKYIFGDIVAGTLFYSDISRNGTVQVKEWRLSYDQAPTDLYTLTGSRRVDLRFGEDCAGNSYILTKADGRIYKILGDRSSEK